MTSLKSKFIACIICYWKKINSIQQEIDWSSHQRYSLRLAVLENGAKLKGKHLFWSLFFKKARGLQLFLWISLNLREHLFHWSSHVVIISYVVQVIKIIFIANCFPQQIFPLQVKLCLYIIYFHSHSLLLAWQKCLQMSF